jgi:hypothetical protein
MLLSFLLWATSLPGQEPEHAAWGYLWQPALAVDNVRREPAFPYEPQPGDLVFFNSADRCWQILYRLAFTGPPTHCGIVVCMPDGTVAILEAGAGSGLDVTIMPLSPRHEGYTGIYVRQRKVPLTVEQCALLTDWAMEVCDKRVGAARFPIQLTPFRRRGPIRTEFLGKPHGIRSTYLCSELVVEACVAAGLLDADTARPAATYPRDLFFDHSCNPYLNRNLNLSDGWCPPALWTEDR